MRTADDRAGHLVHWPAARSWTRRAIRSSNPLLRTPTRLERRVGRLAAAVLVVVTLAVALATWGSYLHGTSAERSQAGTRHQVIATVEGIADPKLVGNRYLVATRVDVTYGFSGTQHRAVVDTRQGASVGTALPIWVDGHGAPSGPPQDRLRTLHDTALTALFGLVLLVTLMAGGRAGYEAWTIDRHLDEWEDEWRRLDTGHRP
jgi:hypothetical protein